MSAVRQKSDGVKARNVPQISAFGWLSVVARRAPFQVAPSNFTRSTQRRPLALIRSRAALGVLVHKLNKVSRMERRVFKIAMRAGAFALSWASFASTAHAYRTLAEAEGLGATAYPVAWEASPTMGWSSRPELGTPLELDASLLEAADAWSVDCGTFAFAASSSSSPDVVVEALGTRWAALGLPSNVPARTDVDYARRGTSDWVITHAHVYLNDAGFEFTIGVPQNDQVSLQAVLRHELGHALGLAHPCEVGMAPILECSDGDLLSVLNPSYFLGNSSNPLAADDIAGVCFLYPTDRCQGVSCGPEQLCEPSSGLCVNSAPSVCASDFACVGGMRCVDGRCAERAGSDGDPCVLPIECASGICDLEGRCVSPCGSVGCRSGRVCLDGLCRTPRGQIGDSCGVPDECTERLCVVGSESGGRCTRLCSPTAVCPVGWQCATLEAREVCVPPLQRSSSCSVGIARRPLGPLAWLLVLTFFALPSRRLLRCM